MLRQHIIKRVTINAKTIADILALEIKILIEMLCAYGMVDIGKLIRILLWYLCGSLLLVDHADQGTVLGGDDALLAEEVGGEGDGK